MRSKHSAYGAISWGPLFDIWMNNFLHEIWTLGQHSTDMKLSRLTCSFRLLMSHKTFINFYESNEQTVHWALIIWWQLLKNRCTLLKVRASFLEYFGSESWQRQQKNVHTVWFLLESSHTWLSYASHIAWEKQRDRNSHFVHYHCLIAQLSVSNMVVWTYALSNCHHFPWSEHVFIYHIIITKKCVILPGAM